MWRTGRGQDLLGAATFGKRTNPSLSNAAEAIFTGLGWIGKMTNQKGRRLGVHFQIPAEAPRKKVGPTPSDETLLGLLSRCQGLCKRDKPTCFSKVSCWFAKVYYVSVVTLVLVLLVGVCIER